METLKRVMELDPTVIERFRPLMQGSPVYQDHQIIPNTDVFEEVVSYPYSRSMHFRILANESGMPLSVRLELYDPEGHIETQKDTPALTGRHTLQTDDYLYELTVCAEGSAEKPAGTIPPSVQDHIINTNAELETHTKELETALASREERIRALEEEAAQAKIGEETAKKEKEDILAASEAAIRSEKEMKSGWDALEKRAETAEKRNAELEAVCSEQKRKALDAAKTVLTDQPTPESVCRLLSCMHFGSEPGGSVTLTDILDINASDLRTYLECMGVLTETSGADNAMNRVNGAVDMDKITETVMEAMEAIQDDLENAMHNEAAASIDAIHSGFIDLLKPVAEQLDALANAPHAEEESTSLAVIRSSVEDLKAATAQAISAVQIASALDGIRRAMEKPQASEKPEDIVIDSEEVEQLRRENGELKKQIEAFEKMQEDRNLILLPRENSPDPTDIANLGYRKYMVYRFMTRLTKGKADDFRKWMQDNDFAILSENDFLSQVFLDPQLMKHILSDEEFAEYLLQMPDTWTEKDLTDILSGDDIERFLQKELVGKPEEQPEPDSKEPENTSTEEPKTTDAPETGKGNEQEPDQGPENPPEKNGTPAEDGKTENAESADGYIRFGQPDDEEDGPDEEL